MILSEKIKAIINVAFSNVFIYGANIVIHLLLPLELSRESYAFWQVHTLYVGYCYLVLLGLNDGIHMLYSNYDYTKSNFPLFRSFRKLGLIMSFVGAILIFLFGFTLDGVYRYITWVIALETPAASLNSIYSYINQGTLRFKKFAKSNVFEGMSLVILIIFLIVFKYDNTLYFILAAAASKYIRLIYNVITAKEISFGKSIKLREIKKDLVKIYLVGLNLAIGVTLYNSFLFLTKVFLKEHFGLLSFGAFSFALNTLAIANVAISAIAQVFFPIMKRTSVEKYSEVVNYLSELVSYFGLVLLVFYFIACYLIQLIYPQYNVILSYLVYIFPIFIFQTKINLEIMNTFKVFTLNKMIIISGLFGVLLNGSLSIISIFIFDSIILTAIIALITYLVIYYSMKLYVKFFVDRSINVGLKDIIYISIFILISLSTYSIYGDYSFKALLVGFTLYSLFIFATLVYNRKKIVNLIYKLR